MRILITGANGQLGYDLVKALRKTGNDFLATGRSEASIYPSDIAYRKLDIIDSKNIEDVFLDYKPDLIFHLAAWTDVDGAEDPENYDLVMKINGDTTREIARLAKKIGAKVIYTSTDYVFDGKGSSPWSADSQDFNPVNIYGQSKLNGEMAIKEYLDEYFIVRISWVFGINGKNFPKTMLRLGKSRDKLTVVDDQIGVPTYTEDLAKLLIDMMESNKYGTYHACCQGDYISWYDLAMETFKIANDLGYPVYENMDVTPISTEEYGDAKAKRPLNSRLDNSKLKENGFILLPNWKDSLKRYIEQIDIEKL